MSLKTSLTGCGYSQIFHCIISMKMKTDIKNISPRLLTYKIKGPKGQIISHLCFPVFNCWLVNENWKSENENQELVTKSWIIFLAFLFLLSALISSPFWIGFHNVVLLFVVEFWWVSHQSHVNPEQKRRDLGRSSSSLAAKWISTLYVRAPNLMTIYVWIYLVLCIRGTALK